MLETGAFKSMHILNMACLWVAMHLLNKNNNENHWKAMGKVLLCTQEASSARHADACWSFLPYSLGYHESHSTQSAMGTTLFLPLSPGPSILHSTHTDCRAVAMMLQTFLPLCIRKCQFSEPQNMSLFGKGVTANMVSYSEVKLEEGGLLTWHEPCS